MCILETIATRSMAAWEHNQRGSFLDSKTKSIANHRLLATQHNSVL